jgi:hypothetical protein
VNVDLVRAIKEKRLIEFVYRIGQPRIAEPHDYGIRNGVERLLVFQISGDSRSGTPHGWKRLDVDGIQQLRVLDRRFPGTRADATQYHRAWDTLFARVT